MLGQQNGVGHGSTRGVPLVVISYYDRRNTDCLQALLASMAAYPAGLPFEALIVVNQTREATLTSVNAPFPIEIAYRENTGMNIGAWDAGLKLRPNHHFYLFLQDECLVARENWLSAFVERCAEPNIGLVGEAFNPAWDAPWQRLKAIHAGATLPDHYIDGRPEPRVDVYLHHMKRWGIDPGPCGRHLRSLAWAASRDALRVVEDFPIGSDYGECIAAEIAVSRKAENAKLKLAQVRATPFYFIRHREWNQDCPGGPFNHAKKPVGGARQDSPRRAEYDAEAMRVQALLNGAADKEGDAAIMIAALLRKLEDRDRHIDALRAQRGRDA